MEKKYQVFISSTYKDLIEARSKVRDAILSMMHFPVGMEMFNAADEEQWEIIQETIDSSDYYVLILGQRYGSVIESGSDAGISYTEKEFRYAREKKIPVLVFIIDDDVAIKPEFIEKDPESIKKLADFKTEAKKGRTVQWWTNIDELAREVSEYKTITNGGVALKLRVLNKGTAKATDIRISIVFPKDIFVYDIDDIEKMKEPKAPKLPPNPIEKAEERFMSDLNPVYGLLKNSMDGMQPFYSARSLPIIDPAIFNNSNSSVFESISIRDNSIFAECNQLPHKDDTEFDGIYIVPARKGKFKVSVSLMCSEYIEPKVHDIEFEIV